MIKTILEENVAEIEVLGSRFIAIVSPLDDEAEFKKIIEDIKRRYPKATHYPFAYRLGPFDRSNEDGEPAHSSAFPVLELLKKRELDHIFVVVVRYFGGTKLGLPRLSRTYLEAAVKAIDEAIGAYIAEEDEISFSCSYPDYDRIRKGFEKADIMIGETIFDLEISLSAKGNGKIIKDIIGQYESVKMLEEKKELVRRRI